MAFPNTERSGKMAHVRYRGGVQGQPPEDVCWEEPTTIRMGVGEVIRGIDESALRHASGRDAHRRVASREGVWRA